MSPPKRIAYILAAFFVASLFFSWLLTRSTRAPEHQISSSSQTNNANNSSAPQNAVEGNAGSIEPSGARHISGEESSRANQTRIVFTASEGRRAVTQLHPEDVSV